MNDLRTALVAFLAVVAGFTGAWLLFGARTAQLAEENTSLRQQTSQLIQQLDGPPQRPDDVALLGRWSTIVEESRLGEIELVFELQENGEVLWESLAQGKSKVIADGRWTLEGDKIHFAVTIVDEESPESGQQKATTAIIKEITEAGMVLDVNGVEWSFHRNT